MDNLNAWGARFLDAAWSMGWQAGLLVLVIGALDLLLQRHVRAAVRYGLWLVLLVKLVLPPSLALPTGAAWWWSSLTQPAAEPATLPPPPLAQTPMVVVSDDDAVLADTSPAEMPAAEPMPGPVLTPAAWGLLAAGGVSVALLGWLVRRWRQVTRTTRTAVEAPTFGPLLADACGRAGGIDVGKVRVKITSDMMSPAVCGLWRPVILLPQSLTETLSPGQLRAVLVHELMHVRRGDVWVNLAQSLLQIVYWWHPLVWVANVRLRRLREEAVDDAVMAALAGDAEIYAPTLLAVAKEAWQRLRASLGLVGILESRSALRQRIERLVTMPAPRKAGQGLVAGLGLLVFSAVALPMGDAPPPPPTPVVVPPKEKPSWPDSRFDGYNTVNMGADFLMLDEAQFRKASTMATMPGFDQFAAGMPEVMPANQVDRLLTGLRQAGAKFFNDYAGGIRPVGWSGVTHYYHIGGLAAGTVGTMELLTTNSAGQHIISGLNIKMPATETDWTPMDLTVLPWQEDDSVRCGLQLVMAGQPPALVPSDFVIPLGGALVWKIVPPGQPDKCQVIVLMDLNYTARLPAGYQTQSIRLTPAVLTNLWISRGGVTTNDLMPDNIIDGLIYDLGLNWLPPRHWDYTNDTLVVQAPVSDLQAIDSLFGGARPNLSGTTGSADANNATPAPAADPGSAYVPPGPNPYDQTGVVHTGSGRSDSHRKLAHIRLGSVDFDHLPLNEVLRRLSAQARELDPDLIGINFLVNANPNLSVLPATVDSATGEPLPAEVLAGLDATAVQVDLHLKDVWLGDVLDAVVLVADHPIQYSVQDFGIVFSAKAAGGAALANRNFKANGDTFFQGLESVGATQFGPGSEGNGTGGGNAGGNEAGATAVVPVVNMFPGAGEARQSSGGGAEYDAPVAPTPTSQPKLQIMKFQIKEVGQVKLRQQTGLAADSPAAAVEAGLYNLLAAAGTLVRPHGLLWLGKQGLLLVHGTRADFVAVDRLVSGFNGGATNDIDQLMSGSNRAFTNNALTGDVTNLYERTFRLDSEVFWDSVQQAGGLSKTSDMKEQVGQLRDLFARFGVNLGPDTHKAFFYNEGLGLLYIKATKDDLDAIEAIVGALNQPPLGAGLGILADSQFQAKIKALENNPASGRLGEPLVTTTIGRGGNSLVAPPIFFPAAGPYLHIQAKFLEVPSLSVPMAGIMSPENTSQALKAFETYTQRTGREKLVGLELTVLSGRQTQLHASDAPGNGPFLDVVPYVLSDGYTINLTMITGTSELGGNNQPTNSERVSTVNLYDGQTSMLGLPSIQPTDRIHKNLVALVTVTIVDPAGNRVHKDDHMPFAPNTVPAQPMPNSAVNPLNGPVANQTNITSVFLGSYSNTPAATTNHSTTLANTNPGRQAIVSKLDQIRLDSVNYDHVPLNEVLRDLRDKARMNDPEKTGINFLISSTATNGEAEPVGATLIKLNLTHVRLSEVLDAITLVADRPIKYSVTDWGIAFSTKTKADSERLFERTYKVNPNSFIVGLESGCVGFHGQPMLV